MHSMWVITVDYC